MARGLDTDAVGFGVELEGAEALRKTLNKLASGTQRKAVRPAVSKALTPINKEAKRRAPKGKADEGGGYLRPGHRPGDLRRSIGKRVKVYKYSGVVWGGVGPRKGHADTPGLRVHWVEFGRPKHNAPAQPFLRPALQAKRAEALRILGKETWRGIEKLAGGP